MNVYEYQSHDPLANRQASEAEGRLAVHNILASYHGNYDLFAEAVQNAVDAVHHRWLDERESGYVPRITVVVDFGENSFSVVDNGVGISPQQCLSVFSPNFSLKSRLIVQGGKRLRGHKGVGATFLAYGFDRTEIASKDSESNLFTGRLNGGRRWAEGEDTEAPRPMLSAYEEGSRDFAALERGTLVRIVCGPGTHPSRLSQLRTDRDTWEGILRIETAIGMIPAAVDVGFEPAVTVRLIQSNGENIEFQIPCRYLFPHEVLEARRFLDMEEYQTSGRGPSIPDSDRNKDGIYRTFTDEQIRAEFDLSEVVGTTDTTLWLYVFRSFSATFFRDQRRTATGRRVYAGVRLAADSMPVGAIQRISNLNRFTYSQNTVQMLLHIEGAEPDIGRKGFSEEVTQLGQVLAKELVEKKLQGWNDFLRSEGGDRRALARLEDWKYQSRQHEETSTLPKWPGASLRVTSTPDREQDVIALFHELLGAGAILGYDVLATSQHARYDSLMWVRLKDDEVAQAIYDPITCAWGVEDYRAEALTRDAVVEAVEYKLDLIGLVDDFRNNAKSFSEVELAIAWSAGQRFDEHADDFELKRLEFRRDLSLRRYPGQTHELRSGSEPGVVPVILLEELFDAVRAGAS